jgi:hypothetical protein
MAGENKAGEGNRFGSFLRPQLSPEKLVYKFINRLTFIRFMHTKQSISDCFKVL